MIWALPYDILLDGVFPFLSGTDLVSLLLTCRAAASAIDRMAWHAAYMREFGPEPCANVDWALNYALRYKSNLYTWGHNRDSRLGFTLGPTRPGAPTSGTPHISESRRGINLPHPVPLDNHIKQIEPGGFGFTLLLTDGSVWQIGHIKERLGSRDPRPRKISGTLEFDSISVGREHVLALAKDSKIYSSTAPANFAMIMGMAPGEEGLVLLPLPLARKIAAGWHINAAINADLSSLQLWPSSLRGRHSLQFDPGTRLTQIEAGADFLLALDEQQRLFWVIIEDGKPHKELVYEELRPTRVRASYNRFALVCGITLYTGHWENGVRTLTKVEGSFCDAALGDHHTLGLTPSGECWVWGRESQRCGSFGLGTQAQIEALGGTAERVGFNMADLLLPAPKKLALKNVLHIAAGGWHSAALASASPDEAASTTPSPSPAARP